ncbi:uncharacterized protein B0H18DRAFT_977322 [Fomitopsis serialis]|uniref:uncharacterized protein n=1 Tax=Fomitopsis serialis TaxID=139415 RepID=UPI0020076F1C|nr:uncharacterized protein B0H18DRAFT_977322 [Neoantrodia serialis]KAH9935791.1 hypothetical protein B0H18DRAFT_977322 [Neoantrodia serialis]
MATEATSATSASGASANAQNPAASPADKGKGKGKFVQEAVADDDDDDEEEDEKRTRKWKKTRCAPRMSLSRSRALTRDDLEAIDPSVIIGTRRTRGVRVDYTSAAALEKAGLKPDDADDDENEDSFVAKDTDMQED